MGSKSRLLQTLVAGSGVNSVPTQGLKWRRGWDSNPRTPVKMLLEFQSSAFDRSATSPHSLPCAQNRSTGPRGNRARMILRPADRGRGLLRDPGVSGLWG